MKSHLIIDNSSKVEELKDSDDDNDSFHSFDEPEHVKENQQIKDKIIEDFEKSVKENTQKEESEEAKNTTFVADFNKAEEWKVEGNELFKSREYLEAFDNYKRAVSYCPDDKPESKAIYLNNKGMALIKLEKEEEAIEAFTESISFNENYLKPRYQKMTILKQQEKYSEAMTEAKAICQRDPNFRGIKGEIITLERLEKEKLEKMKNEVLGNLKNLGNSILGNFGMSLDNFKFNQNPDGTYNISMGK